MDSGRFLFHYGVPGLPLSDYPQPETIDPALSGDETTADNEGRCLLIRNPLVSVMILVTFESETNGFYVANKLPYLTTGRISRVAAFC